MSIIRNKYTDNFTYMYIEAATNIMESSFPQAMKSMGSKIKNFNQVVWQNRISEIAKESITAKFDQNPELKKHLLETNTNVLVEAAPTDKIWGIGFYLHERDILQKKRDWGKNIQGKTLMEIREALKN